jgi:hypothetical protein
MGGVALLGLTISSATAPWTVVERKTDEQIHNRMGT